VPAMKNKSLPAMLMATASLSILTDLTIIFIGDYYSSDGKYSDNGSLYDGRSPLYGTKAMDTEAVQYSIERTEALQEFIVIGSDDMSIFDYGLSRYTLPDAAKPTVDSDASPILDQRMDPAPKADTNTGALYVVYSESLAESGGF